MTVTDLARVLNCCRSSLYRIPEIRNESKRREQEAEARLEADLPPPDVRDRFVEIDRVRNTRHEPGVWDQVPDLDESENL